MAKLVDILARELKEWPDQAAAMAQDENARVAGFIHEDLIYRSGNPGWCGRLDALEAYIRFSRFKCELADDHSTAIVTRAEWQAAVDVLKQKDIASITAAMIDAGWIDPKPPVSPSLHVQVLGRGNRIPQWDGVGLPPVGTRCEMSIGDSGNEWVEGVVVCHINWDRPVAVAHNEEDVFNGYAEDFRPIRTPEQIAAGERKIITDDIQRVCVDGENNGIPFHEALYDAGYRKQEPK